MNPPNDDPCDCEILRALEVEPDPAVADVTTAITSLSTLLPPVPASSALRAKLLATAQGPARFAPFASRLGQLIDVASDQALAMLARLQQPESWQPSPAPHIRLIHLVGGPAVAGADVGFVRVAAGTVFPNHHHRGDETVLVVQGSFVDSTGVTAMPGDRITMVAGTHHHVDAGPETDLIYAVVAWGITVEGLGPLSF